ncbi:uncharacterized protein LOC113468624 [Diaphorina citri]|uniref:Uncharacterized protein LOC113468624 n=1 Tax=Diaphorina citri TaxID=121845 RepID=A0A3Q0IZ78_DIACI|nr:uncharacterized protein LOC113468624 [Diaphorina citri]
MAILSLVFSTSFSLDNHYSLHLHTRSLRPHQTAEDTTDKVYRYIMNGSEEQVNFFYVLDENEVLTAHAQKVLKYYVRAGYNVFLVRVCHTQFVRADAQKDGRLMEGAQESSVEDAQKDGRLKEGAQESSVEGAQRDGRFVEGGRKDGRFEKEEALGDNRLESGSILERFGNSKGDLRNDILGDKMDKEDLHRNVVGNLDKEDLKDLVLENKIDTKEDLRNNGLGNKIDTKEDLRNYVLGKFNAQGDLKSNVGRIDTKGDLESRESAKGGLNIERNSLGNQKEVGRNADNQIDSKDNLSTRDVETYDAQFKKEIQSRFERDTSREMFERIRALLGRNRTFAQDARQFREPITSMEITTEADTELKRVQLCTCPRCSAKTKGKSAFFERKSSLLEGKTAGLDPSDDVLAKVISFSINYREFLRHTMVEKAYQEGVYDMNLVKLLLLWKFGNSLVLLNQETLFHSKFINRSKVNLGFHLIYSPYECSAVMYNLIELYVKGERMNQAIMNVYRMFCKKSGFCPAITYVQLKK